MHNIVQNYKLKQKIAEIFQVDPKSSRRISDYIGSAGFVLENPDIYLTNGKISTEQMETIKEEFKKITDTIISLDIDEIIRKLDQNPPKGRGTESNVESIKEIFIH